MGAERVALLDLIDYCDLVKRYGVLGCARCLLRFQGGVQGCAHQGLLVVAWLFELALVGRGISIAPLVLHRRGPLLPEKAIDGGPARWTVLNTAILVV